jgi:predicted dehydrogenase
MQPEEKPVDIAVVGAGFIGRRHINFLKNHKVFNVVAAADPAPGSDGYLQQQQIPHYTDFRKMLDAVHPEGVIAATPNALHEEVALACMERKIPVLIEKPIAHTIESATRICEAARKSGVPVLVGHHRRHNPLMRAALEFLRDDGIGDFTAVAAFDLRRKPDSYYKSSWRREPGGGPMLINGIHDVDCLRSLCGEIDSLMALTANKARGFPVEDTAAVTFRFENGGLGNLTISDAVQAPWAWEVNSGEEPEYPYIHADCYLITGTKGALSVPTLTHWHNEHGGGRADPFLRKKLFYVPADPWVEELKHFARVARGLEKSLIDAEDGLRTLAATLAVARSAETGRPVTMKEMYS